VLPIIVTVNWAEGSLPCLGQMDQNLPSGVLIEAYGEVIADDTLTICTSEELFLRVKQ